VYVAYVLIRKWLNGWKNPAVDKHCMLVKVYIFTKSNNVGTIDIFRKFFQCINSSKYRWRARKCSLLKFTWQSKETGKHDFWVVSLSLKGRSLWVSYDQFDFIESFISRWRNNWNSDVDGGQFNGSWLAPQQQVWTKQLLISVLKYHNQNTIILLKHTRCCAMQVLEKMVELQYNLLLLLLFQTVRTVIEKHFDNNLFLQVQRSFSCKDTGMGCQVNVNNRNHWELVNCSESLDIFGSSVCWWRHRQAIASGTSLSDNCHVA